MPLFSEHISNMYYSGTPSYMSSPYSYSSSYTPLTTSYSASYLNPGASYNNHSSLGYSRPLTSRWIPSTRSYSPILSTISERGSSTPVRVNSPRRVPIQSRSNRTYVPTNYTSRPVNINTADIDVSRNKYKKSTADVSLPPQPTNTNVGRDKSPLNSRVESKPETGIDTSPGVKRGTIKRDRTVVRLHTLKRKERDSPRKPVGESQSKGENVKTENDEEQCKNKEEPAEPKRWREKLSDDLIYKDTREKKTLGEKLVEKFQVKNKDSDVTEDKLSILKRQQNLVKVPSVEQNATINNKSLDRRCSMEMLAEQACLLDSLIRKENLSTATLDLSKIGTNEDETSNKDGCEEQPTKNLLASVPLTTTKSDHSLHNRLLKLKDQKHTAKRKSVKKSASGGNISKLNSITEIPKEASLKNLSVIDEIRQSLKDVEQKPKPKPKPIIKTKITSTVDITPPSSPLRFKVENITVDEKLRSPKKEIIFSSEIENATVQNEDTIVANTNNISPPNTVPDSPEPEDGNFWNKIGKRETVYLMTRKQKLAKSKEEQQKTLFWYPEEETEYSQNACDNKEREEENPKNIQAEDQNFRTKVNEKQIHNKEEETEQKQEKPKSTKSSMDTENVIKAECDVVSSLEGPKESPVIKMLPIDNKLTPKIENKELTENTKLINSTATLKESIESKENFTTESISEISKSSLSNDEGIIQTKLDNSHVDATDKSLPCDLSAKKLKRISIENGQPCDSVEVQKELQSEKPKKVKKVVQKTKDERPQDKITSNKKIKTTDIALLNNQNKTINEFESNVNNNIVHSESNNFVPEEKLEKETSINVNVKEIDAKAPENEKSDNSVINKNDDEIELFKEKEEDSTNIVDQDKVEVPRLPSEKQNIPSCVNNDSKVQVTDAEEITNMSNAENENEQLKRASVKPVAAPIKPVKEEKALKPLIATPRPLQKKVPPMVRSSSSSESSSDDTTSDDDEDEEETSESESSGEFFECENPDGRTSTGSNDSGFDSCASTSPAGFSFVRKDCDVNCHRKCEKLTANLCGVNQRLLVEALATRTASKREQSTAYGLFRKTGRFTPPARSIPRFRKYTIEDFQFIKVLGKGSFGKVLLAELRDTEYYYAVKCLKKDVVLEDDDVECTLIERKVLALGTNHPYLCHLFATFQTDSHLFFVMEYLNGGDLMFHIQQSGRFPEPRARFYAAEIVSGLKFLHKRGIIYRDLKLDNILLDFDGHVRIADFGMCKLQIYLDKTADTFCGTPDYMAPEIIKGLKYNQAVDWWSFGVLLYEMLIGQSPFSGCDEDELFWSICNEMPSYPRFLSKESLSILTRLLDKDAHTRLGGPDCMHGDIRDQDFFHPVIWDRLERRELEAPFKPRVRHPLDTQYFDRAFTGERPRLTAVEPHVLRSMDQEPFRGFSYTNPNATDR